MKILTSLQLFLSKDSWYSKIIWLGFGITNSINRHLRLKIPYTNNTNFYLQIIMNCIRQTKSEWKIYNFRTAASSIFGSSTSQTFGGQQQNSGDKHFFLNCKMTQSTLPISNTYIYYIYIRLWINIYGVFNRNFFKVWKSCGFRDFLSIKCVLVKFVIPNPNLICRSEINKITCKTGFSVQNYRVYISAFKELTTKRLFNS